MARPTYHASKTAIRPKTKKSSTIADERSDTVTVASTAATSAVGDTGARWPV